MILYKLCAVWLLNLPCVGLFVYEVTDCLYVIASIKRLIIPGGTSVEGCTDLSDKELHRQVGVNIVISGKPT